VTTDLDVVIPAYGDDALLREAIASVRSQDDPRWRLTVIDDGVEEGRSGDLASALAGDPRVRYLPNPVRLGINRNFQRCLDEATGDWVMLLGADDRLRPDLVGRVHAITAEHPSAAWLHTDAVVIDETGAPVAPLADKVKARTKLAVTGETRVSGGEELSSSLLHGNWMYFPSCVFRREVALAHGFREGYDIVLDLDLYLRMLLAGGECVLLRDPGIEYRRHAASLSSAGAVDGTRFTEETDYFAEVAAELADRGWNRAARAARWHWTSRAHGVAKLPGLLRAGEFDTARRILSLAVSTTDARRSTLT
jgi:glycosyltransferase involved in cell wall biosynthesis